MAEELSVRISRLASECGSLVGLIPDESCSPTELGEQIKTARRLQRLCDGLIVKLATQALVLEAAGVGGPAEEALRADGVVPLSQTRTEVRRSRLVEHFPNVGRAIDRGEARLGNVDALAATVARMTPHEVEALANSDGALAMATCKLNEDSFRRRVARMRNKIRDDDGTTAHEQSVNDSRLVVAASRDKSGYRIAGWLDPLRGAAIQAAVAREARALSKLPDAVGLTFNQLCSQAHHDLVMRGDATDRNTVAARANVQITVLVDRQTLESGPHDQSIMETDDGLELSPGAVGRLCCDATLRRVDTSADGQVAVSQKSRTANPAQRAALRALYDTCPLSGEPWSRIEIHHTVFYEQSQRTVLSELVPISRRWHHLIHDQGWRLEMDADRTLHLFRPDGSHDRTLPPPVPVNQRTRMHHQLAA